MFCLILFSFVLNRKIGPDAASHPVWKGLIRKKNSWSSLLSTLLPGTIISLGLENGIQWVQCRSFRLSAK